MICNLVHNICTFKVSGWYFGKTGGLLGVYDNEPSNDRMTSNRMIVDDLKTFTNSWQITDSCANNYAEIVNDETEWDKQKCSDYFEKTSSPMVPCFETVNPIHVLKADGVYENQSNRNKRILPSCIILH